MRDSRQLVRRSFSEDGRTEQNISRMGEIARQKTDDGRQNSEIHPMIWRLRLSHGANQKLKLALSEAEWVKT